MSDDRLRDEHYLVDGVAPSVIGGEDPIPEPEYRDPPTAPIPAAEAPAEPKKSWFGRVFSPRSSR
jgi:hypothetical protein